MVDLTFTIMVDDAGKVEATARGSTTKADKRPSFLLVVVSQGKTIEILMPQITAASLSIGIANALKRAGFVDIETIIATGGGSMMPMEG